MTRPRELRGSTAVPAPTLPVERFLLKCGAVLLVSHRPGAPVTAAQVHLRGGHALDPEGLEGTAYLAGSLTDQGTERRGEEEIAQLLEPAGGSLGGDGTGLSGTIASRHWKLLLELLCDLLTAPSYPKRKVERQKRRLLDRLLVELSLIHI